jgi:acetyl esterase/lipase
MKYFLALFLVASGSLFAADNQKSVGEMFVYKKVDGRELKLYVNKPADWKSSDQRPAIVFFHGGGWVGGTPSSFNGHCEYFASRGLVCATVEYRLIRPKTNGTPLVCIQDAKSAMRWVRSHANELGIDPERIASAGGSAGGHLAAFCGLVDGKDDPQDDLSVSSKSNAMILFNPVFNNGPGQYGYGRVGEHYKEFSPAHNITKGAPPAVIFLGTKDHLIPVEVAQDFQAQMKNVGAKCELHLYEGQGHGFYNAKNPKYYYETIVDADKFLAELGWVKGPPTFKMPPAQPKAASRRTK